MKAKSKKKLMKLFKSKIAINGIWLYILQIFNTMIPLITLPYITRTLGPSQYGVFSSALNLVGYFLVIVEYGFNLSGVRKVAIAKDKNEISEIYSRITSSKLILFLLAFCIMIIISRLIDISRTTLVSMIILFFMVLGAAIQQTWLFQGLQEMKFITLISVISRTISVLMIFLVVKNSSQVYLYSFLYSITLLLNGVMSILIIKFKFRIKFRKIKVREIFYEIKDGWYLFITSAMTKVFSGIGITVLAFTSSESAVGIYSAIQKIPLMIIMSYAPIGQIIFPYVSKRYTNSLQSGVTVIRKIIKIILVVISIIGIIIIINSKAIISILYGDGYSGYSFLLTPLIIWTIISVLNNLLGIQILVASGHLKEYSVSFRIGVIAILIFNFSLGYKWDIYGVAIAAMLAEITLTIALIFQINKILKN